MLLCLGHDPLVRRHHQQGQVDAARPRQHIADEFLMARHVDDPRLAPIRQVQICKPQLNGNASALFLLQPVRIDAGQGVDQAGFPMVHMARRADDHIVHAVSSFMQASTAWARAGICSSATVRISSSTPSLWIRAATGRSSCNSL